MYVRMYVCMCVCIHIHHALRIQLIMGDWHHVQCQLHACVLCALHTNASVGWHSHPIHIFQFLKRILETYFHHVAPNLGYKVTLYQCWVVNTCNWSRSIFNFSVCMQPRMKIDLHVFRPLREALLALWVHVVYKGTVYKLFDIALLAHTC